MTPTPLADVGVQSTRAGCHETSHLNKKSPAARGALVEKVSGWRPTLEPHAELGPDQFLGPTVAGHRESGADADVELVADHQADARAHADDGSAGADDDGPAADEEVIRRV